MDKYLIPEESKDQILNLPETEMLARIQERVLFLLKNDFNHLVQSLYRLDIPEKAFNQAMEQKSEALVAEFLSRIIYQRELQKAESRRKYKATQNQTPPEDIDPEHRSPGKS